MSNYEVRKTPGQWEADGCNTVMNHQAKMAINSQCSDCRSSMNESDDLNTVSFFFIYIFLCEWKTS